MGERSVDNFDGQKLKKLMKQKGYTTQSFEDETGIARTGLARYFNGSNKPTKSILKLICLTLGCKEEDLQFDIPVEVKSIPTAKTAANILVNEELSTRMSAVENEIKALRNDLSGLAKYIITMNKGINETKAQAELNRDEIQGVFNKVGEINGNLNKITSKVTKHF